MAALSKAAMKRRSREAEAFARRAQAGRTYYVVDARPDQALHPKTVRDLKKIGSNMDQRLLREIHFEPPTLSSRQVSGKRYPRWFGPHTAYDAYLKIGPIYETRDHRDIRGMKTWTEFHEELEKMRAGWLGSAEYAEWASDTARTGGFRPGAMF